MRVKPFLDDREHGLFATRAPARPNQIGISVVRLIRIDNKTLYVQDIDIIDQTPLLDIKPFVPDFDVRDEVTIGWLKEKSENGSKTIADGRFND